MSRGVWIYHHTTSEMEPEIAVSPPRHYDLAQNFPNPFNPETTMHYDLPANEFVTLEIFNLEGQLIEQLVNQYQAAGHYSVRWNAVNTHRKKVSSGIYLYRLRAGTFQVTKKMTLLQ
jgi:hypothetical protein